MSPEERARLVERDKKYIWHPYTPMESYISGGRPLVIGRAQGSRFYDVDGRSYLDGNSSWWTSLLGHNHPRLVAALERQARDFCHVAFAGTTHEAAVEFAESLVRVAPEGLGHVFFSDNGSTAVEAGIKMCAQYWAQNGHPEKTRFLALEHAFHGETLGVTALGGVPAFRRPFSALTMPTAHLPSPAFELERALDALEAKLKAEAQVTAALVIEPLIQGAGGMQMYAPEYLKRARELTAKHDVLLLVDEVFTGYGRTGKFWAVEHAGIVPDVVATAKGLSGGLLPFSATLVTDRIFEGFFGGAERAFYYGHTYAGNPLGAAIAREVLAVYEDERIVEGVEPRARVLAESFARMAEWPGVSRVRSLGLVAALELTEGEDYLSPSGWRVYESALERGAYVRPLGNVVYLCPPLNIPEEELRELCSIVEESVRENLPG